MPKRALIFVIVCCIGCAINNVDSRPFVFDNEVAIKDSLMHVIKFDSIQFEETAHSENEILTTEFNITIINPQPFPTDSLKLYSIARPIAIIAKKNIDNPRKYNVFRVDFYSEEEIGIGILRTRKTIHFNEYDLN